MVLGKTCTLNFLNNSPAHARQIYRFKYFIRQSSCGHLFPTTRRLEVLVIIEQKIALSSVFPTNGFFASTGTQVCRFRHELERIGQFCCVYNFDANLKKKKKKKKEKKRCAAVSVGRFPGPPMYLIGCNLEQLQENHCFPHLGGGGGGFPGRLGDQKNHFYAYATPESWRLD